MKPVSNYSSLRFWRTCQWGPFGENVFSCIKGFSILQHSRSHRCIVWHRVRRMTDMSFVRDHLLAPGYPRILLVSPSSSTFSPLRLSFSILRWSHFNFLYPAWNPDMESCDGIRGAAIIPDRWYRKGGAKVATPSQKAVQVISSHYRWCHWTTRGPVQMCLPQKKHL